MTEWRADTTAHKHDRAKIGQYESAGVRKARGSGVQKQGGREDIRIVRMN